MALNRKLAGGTLAMLMAIASPPVIPSKTVSASPQQLAQVAPTSITGRLDSSSQVLDDGSYYNVHTFEGITGQPFEIEMVSEDFDAYFILIGPSGNVVAEADDSAAGTNAFLLGFLPETGTYQLLANSYGAGETGQYALRWYLSAIVSQDAESAASRDTESTENPQDNLSVPATTQPPGLVTDTVTGEFNEDSLLSDGSYSNSHAFEGTSGDAIAIEVTGDGFETSLSLTHGYSVLVPFFRGRGEGYTDIALATLPYDGRYYISVNASNPGRYELSIRPLTADEQSNLSSRVPVYSTDRSSTSDFSPETILQDSYTQAVPLVEQQIDVLRAQLGSEHPEVANQVLGLASLYLVQQRFADAETLLVEALEIYRLRPELYPAERALTLNYLGEIASARGQCDQAESFLQQSLAILTEDPGEREDLIPQTQRDLALILVQCQSKQIDSSSLANKSLQDDPESLLLQAIEALRNDNDSLSLGDMIDTLATLYFTQGRYEEAESLYRETLEIYRGFYPDNDVENPRISTSLNNIALIYQVQGRYSEAEELYKEALDNYDAYISSISTLGDNGYTTPYIQRSAISRRIYMVPVLYNLAGLYRATGKVSQAIETLGKGIEIEEENLDIALANLSDRDRIAYVAKLYKTLNYVVSLHLDTASDSTQAAQFALINLLRRKGRVTEAGITAQETLRQRGTRRDIELLDQLTKLQQEIATLTSQPPDILTQQEYQTRLARLRSEVNLIETAIARQSADMALVSQSVDLDAVQKQLPADGVLVEYALYQPFDPTNPVGDNREESNLTAANSNNFAAPRYAAYLLFPDGRIEAIDLGSAAEIDAAVQSFVGLLQNRSAQFRRNAPVPTLREEDVEQVTSNIKELVFDPIAPYLGDTDHLLISPDGQLNLLPFEALQPAAGGEYLVQQYQISYLNSGRDLLKFDVIEPSRNPAVVLANPDYETADDTVQIAQGRRTGDSRRSIELSQLQVGPLPGTAKEAEAIEPLLPNAEILVGNEATENVLKSVQAPRILHIATHGFFLPNVERPEVDSSLALASSNPFGSVAAPGVAVENPLLRSGLALAGFNTRSSGSEDGVLTALEASQLNLFGTQLVVLSACDTGLGDIANGEGVYGLRRAFAIAGAETQLLSLWQVSDFGTQSLMARYYENLTAGMGRSEALREVQLEMIEEGGEYSHPYYWAAFILAGDWRSLE